MANIKIQVSDNSHADKILNKVYDADRLGGFIRTKKLVSFVGSVITATKRKADNFVEVHSTYYSEESLKRICE